MELIEQRTTSDMTLVKDQFDIQTIRELLHVKAQDGKTGILNPYDEIQKPKSFMTQIRNCYTACPHR